MSKKKTAKPVAKKVTAKKPVKATKKAPAKKTAPAVKKVLPKKKAAPVKKAPIKKKPPLVKRAPAQKSIPPAAETRVEAAAAPPSTEHQEASSLAPGIPFRVRFPQGDTVGLVFDATGTSPGKNITNVVVTQDLTVIGGVTWVEKQAPMAPTGAWIVTVTMPDESKGTYDIAVTDNLGHSDTGSFVI